MKRKILLAGFIVAVIFCSCDPKKSKEYIAAQQEIDSLRVVNLNKESEVDSLFDALNEIEDNLAIVASKFKKVEEIKKEGMENANTANTREKIKGYINDINQILESNKKKVAVLNSQINKAEGKYKTLSVMLEKLEVRIKEQDAQIESLLAELERHKITIDSLNVNVQNLERENAEKDEFIAQKIAEANIAFYILGNYKDLKENNIVNKEGGFIGIGTRKVMSKDVDLNKFTKIDIRKISSIPIGSKKVKVISQHPEESYELQTNDQGVVENLRIKNIDEFWKLTKYLIVEIK